VKREHVKREVKKSAWRRELGVTPYALLFTIYDMGCEKR
jgi:hypothetical protein